MTQTSPCPPGAADLLAATPPDRDRYADLLWLFSIGVVVVGHWVVALLTLHGPGEVSSSRPTQLSTWLWQVMALFFFVGGFAHAQAFRSTRPAGPAGFRPPGHRPATGAFVRARAARLLPPAVAMVAIWTGLTGLLAAAGLTDGVFALGLHTITVPLWFLAVYLVIGAGRADHDAAAPAVRAVAGGGRARRRDRLGRRRGAGGRVAPAGVREPAVRLAGGAPAGIRLRDGTLLAGGRRLAAGLAGAGLGTNVLLVFGLPLVLGGRVCPVLMVGQPGNEISNTSPPTLALLAQGLFLVGLALLRPAGTAWAAGRRTWLVVVGGNSVVMTMFCWHLTACYLVQVALLAAGVRLPAADTPWWLVVLPVWLAGCAGVCAVLVRALRRFEASRASGNGSAAVASAGVVCAVVGLFGVSRVGLDGLVAGRPAAAALALVLLGWATRCSTAQPPGAPGSRLDGSRRECGHQQFGQEPPPPAPAVRSGSVSRRSGPATGPGSPDPGWPAPGPRCPAPPAR